MVDRLNEPESRFHGSLVTNVLDLVEILPQLNVGEDPDLNRFADQIATALQLSGAGPQEARPPARHDGSDAAARREMDAVLRSANRRRLKRPFAPASGPTADDIFTHMSAYMEAAAA